ncbi:uncharacterized protein TNIN_302561 [Trichonephila inaurata madagascariensis]|uniref:Uncharacterized protein n=1 Tax=Trichonephila inaurata madagascariensis TaxID=2747483 RepID=A0A8X7BWN1_9ARAC|nr:uncharacterized protein TNIN_302561 [Trichonephila inaurata madagascariensis]
MIKVTTGRLIGVGIATCIVTSASIYMRTSLADRIKNQKLCIDCYHKLLLHSPSVRFLGEPVILQKPNLSNEFNHITKVKATIALPVSGSKKSGELLIDASRNEDETKWTINYLKLKVKKEEILIE